MTEIVRTVGGCVLTKRDHQVLERFKVTEVIGKLHRVDVDLDTRLLHEDSHHIRMTSLDCEAQYFTVRWVPTLSQQLKDKALIAMLADNVKR